MYKIHGLDNKLLQVTKSGYWYRRSFPNIDKIVYTQNQYVPLIVMKYTVAGYPPEYTATVLMPYSINRFLKERPVTFDRALTG